MTAPDNRLGAPDKAIPVGRVQVTITLQDTASPDGAAAKFDLAKHLGRVTVQERLGIADVDPDDLPHPDGAA